jgi:t-SNARE complex subunit (syntaxin)
MNEKKIEKIAKAFEDVSNRSVNAMENLESKLNDLDTNTKKNKIIIWSIACVIAAIIILLRD